VRFRDEETVEISPTSTAAHIQHPFHQWRDLPFPYN
jgi:hypothetical protein